MTAEKFLDGTDVYTPIPYTGCWEWLMYRDRYGIVRYKGELHKAHRLMYELTKGEIPEGMQVCHTCDNPSCVNPDHLWIGTQADNVRDMCDKGRNSYGDQRGENHSGVKLTEEDVIVMRKYYTWGISSITELAQEFGVGYAQAWAIVKRKSWTHI